LFEKSHKPGGRVASRFTDAGVFDHGAQFFYVKTDAFNTFIQPMLADGVIANWPARFVEIDNTTITRRTHWDDSYPHYVGTPSMSAMMDWLANGMNIHYEHTISGLVRHKNKWQLSVKDKRLDDLYDWVIFTMPVPQVCNLVPPETEFLNELKQIDMLPCYALMLSLKQLPTLDFDAALIHNSNLSWISINHTKPMRQPMTLVSHAANLWARDHMETEISRVQNEMIESVKAITGFNDADIVHKDIKHWHFANTPKQKGPTHFVDNDLQLATCGDWCIQGRIESAYTSADALATELIS
jgi:hypothetical protein